MTEHEKKLVAQMQKDGYSAEAIAFVMKSSGGIKATCDYGTAVGAAKVANALRYWKPRKYL